MVRHRLDVALAVGVALGSTLLVAGWHATGHAAAPDAGLHQIDLLMLHERVSGVTAEDGQPTLLVVTGEGCPDAGPPPEDHLPPRHAVRVSTDARLADRLALPEAVRCQSGYVLVDRQDVVRYRTYDVGWREHAQEQRILLDALDGDHG